MILRWTREKERLMPPGRDYNDDDYYDDLDDYDDDWLDEDLDDEDDEFSVEESRRARFLRELDEENDEIERRSRRWDGDDWAFADDVLWGDEE
jgi:hypothetical protein